ncbi:MAG: hypothetical protein KKC51_06610 [Verrucomicrobia bacterium]|nr:hypothetical protein [Verrucomicrobiota bacterium]
MKKLTWIARVASFTLILATCARGYEISCGNEEPPLDDEDEVGIGSIKPYNANMRRHVADLETFDDAPVGFTRIYNSRTTTFTTNYMDFGWKQTWQHNWNYEVRDLTSTTFGHKDVKVRYPSGSEFNFKAADTSGVIRVPFAYHGDRLYKWTGGTVGHTLVTPQGWEYDFQRTTAPRYRLIHVRNGQGLTWTLSYDGNGKLERIENDFGRWLEIERSVTNGILCITGVRSSDGREVAYRYDAWVDGSLTNNVLTAVGYPDGSQAEYTYVGAQSLTNGRPLLATASDSRHPGPGARVKYLYNYDAIFDFGNGPYLVTGTTLEERNLDTDEVIVQLSLGAGDYPQNLLGDGTEITRKYTNGLLVEKGDGEGRPTFFTRDQGGSGYIGVETDVESNTTTYARDFAGRVLHEIDSMGFTNSFSYNSAGFLTNQTDKLGHPSTYTRDTNNLLSRIDYPDCSFEEWTYNQYGQSLTHRLRNGGTEAFAYYGTNETGGLFGDLKTRTDAMSNTTTYTWNSAGLMTSLMDARGNIIRFAYDWRGQILSTTNADSTVVLFQYDAFGNRTNAVDESGHATANTFDQYNRVHTVRDPLGRVTEYEYGRMPGCGGCGVFGGTITRIIDPAGKVTEYAYDRSDKRTNETIAVGTAEAATTIWTYDAVGRLKTQTDANGNPHTWSYDALGRVVAETNALDEVTTCSYDAVGNLTNRTDGASVVTFWEYDSLNRATALGSGTLRYEYEYDLGGRRTAMHTRVNGVITETTSYAYDLNDKLLTKTDPTGYTLSYAYDPTGNRTNFSVTSVVNISYEYDSRNRLVAMTGNDKTTSFGYDELGRSTTAVWPNGTTAAYTYDSANQLLSLVHGRAGSTNPPLASFEYANDLSGNRTNMITLEGTNSYAYDARNWLTSAAYPDGHVQEFEYDPVGNRTGLTESGTGVPPVEVAYTYGPANRLLLSASAIETNGYFYDDAGRLISQTVNDQLRTHDYSFRSQMTSLADTNGSIFSYAFDGDGNRISQSLNDCLTTRFVYDGPNVVLDVNASNEIAHAYINGLDIDQPIERIAFINGSPRLRQVFHADALGSIVAMTDDSGESVKTYAYESFGRIRSETGGDLVLNRYTFTGREALGDSFDFSYYRNRIMDPNIGRFTSADPLDFIDGPNQYGYVRNNPLAYTDQSGTATFEGCTGDQKDRIKAAWNTACNIINSCQFGSCFRHEVYKGCMRRKCAERGSYRFRCGNFKSDCSTACANGMVNRNLIEFCPGQFTNRRCPAMYRTIAHELVHNCGDRSRSGGWPDRALYCTR